MQFSFIYVYVIAYVSRVGKYSYISKDIKDIISNSTKVTFKMFGILSIGFTIKNENKMDFN